MFTEMMFIITFCFLGGFRLRRCILTYTVYISNLNISLYNKFDLNSSKALISSFFMTVADANENASTVKHVVLMW